LFRDHALPFQGLFLPITCLAHPRLIATRSCAPQLRIIVTSALSTRLTRTWTSFPAFVVYGRPVISHSPVSSEPVAELELHGHAAIGRLSLLLGPVSSHERSLRVPGHACYCPPARTLALRCGETLVGVALVSGCLDT
jgi:hypothetical protein